MKTVNSFIRFSNWIIVKKQVDTITMIRVERISFDITSKPFHIKNHIRKVLEDEICKT